MWFEHHDDAYQWAARKRLEVHPATGALQVIEPVLSEEAAPSGRLFAQVKDKHLLGMGVPEELIAIVRSMNTDADLEAAEVQFPQEAYEALFLLASGYAVEDVFRELEKKPDEVPVVDTKDFSTAEDSQRRFYVVEGAQDLAEVISAPLEQWRIFLHPKQRALVQRNWNGPIRVLGGAGTGKTVVAMHRARYLAEEVFRGSGDRILFTTFTKNLATDIEQNLRKLCTDDKAWTRIEVRHLNGWVMNFLRTQGYRQDPVYNSEGNTM